MPKGPNACAPSCTDRTTHRVWPCAQERAKVDGRVRSLDDKQYLHCGCTSLSHLCGRNMQQEPPEVARELSNSRPRACRRSWSCARPPARPASPRRARGRPFPLSPYFGRYPMGTIKMVKLTGGSSAGAKRRRGRRQQRRAAAGRASRPCARASPRAERPKKNRT